jgi:F-type H+-transporting ATPase subunit delta
MRAGAIARRYARALFGLAETNQSLEPVASALATITDTLVEPSVMRVLTGPLAKQRKRELLLKIISTTTAPPILRDFLLFAADQDRLRQVPAMRVVFEALLDDKRGITRATIRSAVPLSPDMLAETTRVFGTITGKEVVAQVEVVPELIAGVIVEVGGKVYDGSLRSQLDKLHQQMATGS